MARPADWRPVLVGGRVGAGVVDETFVPLQLTESPYVASFDSKEYWGLKQRYLAYMVRFPLQAEYRSQTPSLENWKERMYVHLPFDAHPATTIGRKPADPNLEPYNTDAT